MAPRGTRLFKRSRLAFQVGLMRVAPGQSVEVGQLLPRRLVDAADRLLKFRALIHRAIHVSLECRQVRVGRLLEVGKPAGHSMTRNAPSAARWIRCSSSRSTRAGHTASIE